MAVEDRDTEKELIALSVKGDQQAFRKIYEKHSPKMYMVALRYMNSDHDAQDVLQESFIKIYQKLSSFQFAGSFEGWCRRIVVHTAIEFLRKSKQNLVEGMDSLEKRATPSLSLEKLQMEDLLNSIQKLPAGYRTVFNMYIIEGYSHKEIAQELSISVSTSKSQLFKARNYLQELLAKTN